MCATPGPPCRITSGLLVVVANEPNTVYHYQITLVNSRVVMDWTRRIVLQRHTKRDSEKVAKWKQKIYEAESMSGSILLMTSKEPHKLHELQMGLDSGVGCDIQSYMACQRLLS